MMENLIINWIKLIKKKLKKKKNLMNSLINDSNFPTMNTPIVLMMWMLLFVNVYGAEPRQQNQDPLGCCIFFGLLVIALFLWAFSIMCT